MAVLSRRRASPALLTSLAVGAWVALSAHRTLLDFVQPGGEGRGGQSEHQQAAQQASVSRADALRWLPAAAVATLGAAPSYGEGTASIPLGAAYSEDKAPKASSKKKVKGSEEPLKSGVTKAWGFKQQYPGSRNREEDDIHLGGVEWEDLKIGIGETPQIGDLVTVNFKVSAVVRGQEVVIDDTSGKPRDFTYGTGEMLPGIDEGVFGMKTGGVRKMRVPGRLAFGNQAVPAKVGRPALPPNLPIEVELTLENIPGRDDPYLYGEYTVGMDR